MLSGKSDDFNASARKKCIRADEECGGAAACPTDSGAYGVREIAEVGGLIVEFGAVNGRRATSINVDRSFRVMSIGGTRFLLGSSRA